MGQRKSFFCAMSRLFFPLWWKEKWLPNLTLSFSEVEDKNFRTSFNVPVSHCLWYIHVCINTEIQDHNWSFLCLFRKENAYKGNRPVDTRQVVLKPIFDSNDTKPWVWISLQCTDTYCAESRSLGAFSSISLTNVFWTVNTSQLAGGIDRLWVNVQVRL